MSNSLRAVIQYGAWIQLGKETGPKSLVLIPEEEFKRQLKLLLLENNNDFDEAFSQFRQKLGRQVVRSL